MLWWVSMWFWVCLLIDFVFNAQLVVQYFMLSLQFLDKYKLSRGDKLGELLFNFYFTQKNLTKSFSFIHSEYHNLLNLYMKSFLNETKCVHTTNIWCKTVFVSLLCKNIFIKEFGEIAYNCSCRLVAKITPLLLLS